MVTEYTTPLASYTRYMTGRKLQVECIVKLATIILGDVNIGSLVKQNPYVGRCHSSKMLLNMAVTFCTMDDVGLVFIMLMTICGIFFFTNWSMQLLLAATRRAIMDSSADSLSFTYHSSTNRASLAATLPSCPHLFQ